MKLWLLEAREDLPENGSNPWQPWYDKAFGFVIRAETEADARQIATENAGDEIRAGHAHAWTDPKLSTCIELTADGEVKMILREYARA